MENFKTAVIKSLIIHKIGNPVNGGEIILSDKTIDVSDETLQDILKSFFVGGLKNTFEYFQFKEEKNKEMNILNNECRIFFENRNNIVPFSQVVANHLFEQSQHPKIKDGELYVVHFHYCHIDDKQVDAIGIFKTESKDKFLKINVSKGQIDFNLDEGISLGKIDKGCVVYNINEDKGFKLHIFDNTNKLNDTIFWREEFLKIQAFEDGFFQTKSFIGLCKDFVEEVMVEEQQIDKVESMALLQNSVDYFQKNQNFNKREFEEEVLQKEEIIQAFNNFQVQHFEQQELPPLPDDFEISTPAVKNQKKYIKSVIKLDKNFHIYVHAKHDYIDKGYDEDRNLKYYKLYYENEE